MDPKLHKYAKLLVSEYNKLVDEIGNESLAGIENYEDFIPPLEGVKCDTLETLMTSAYGRAFLTGYLMGYPPEGEIIVITEDAMEGSDGQEGTKKITH